VDSTGLSWSRRNNRIDEILHLGKTTKHTLPEPTSVIVARRLSTVRKADRILVLHHGQLREEGSHEQLVAIDGIYARLVALPFGKS
jgi:ABC-type multidrug transport system fused ATPase/permease subunit